MILLENYSFCVDQVLLDRFAAIKEDGELRAKFDKNGYNVADFDGVTYQIINPKGDSKQILVSVSMECYKDLVKHGVPEFLKEVYGDMLCAEPAPNQSVTLRIDSANLPDNYSALARKCATLKRNCMAGLFTNFFNIQTNLGGKPASEEAVIPYRKSETLRIQALSDRVTVVFHIVFVDADDMVMANLFLTEFVESRRRLDRAPQVIYTRKPVSESGKNLFEADVTFILHPRHFASDAARQKTIDLLQNFRNYLHYHIQCTKAYIQMRMRAKTVDFLKVVNRATVVRTIAPVINVLPVGEDTSSLKSNVTGNSGASGHG